VALAQDAIRTKFYTGPISPKVFKVNIMVRCSFFGKNSKEIKKYRSSSTSLTREQTIATAFFSKCKAHTQSNKKCNCQTDNNENKDCASVKGLSNLAPML